MNAHIGTMHLDSIEACINGIAGRLSELLNDLYPAQM